MSFTKKRGIPCLAKDTFPNEVVKIKFTIKFIVVNARNSKENILSITVSGNAFCW